MTADGARADDRRRRKDAMSKLLRKRWRPAVAAAIVAGAAGASAADDAALRDDVSVLIELAIRARDGVRIHRELLRELVDRRQLLVACERARGERRGHALVDLAIHGHAAVVIEPNVERHHLLIY